MDMDAIAHVIQLAIAPVFLLTGIGAILGAMTNRLARIVDRARALEDRLPAAAEPEAETMHTELGSLARRARLIYRAIALAVVSALLICTVIVGLFISAYLAPDLTRAVATLFGTALLALIASLLLFLREIYLATAALRIGFR